MEPTPLEPRGMFWSRGDKVSATQQLRHRWKELAAVERQPMVKTSSPTLQLLPHRDRELRCRQTPTHTPLPCRQAHIIADFVFLSSLFPFPSTFPPDDTDTQERGQAQHLKTVHITFAFRRTYYISPMLGWLDKITIYIILIQGLRLCTNIKHILSYPTSMPALPPTN